ncbi:MAG TPA: HAD-IA family hydrolase [Tepidisphaeraceae bacterium]|jgi:HAD superfamily hydrolase (TIGR01509 family)
MASLHHLRGVIFDMDGVLCDSEPFICEAACRMFAERHATVVQPEDFVPFVGAGENRYLGGVAEKHGITLNMPSDKQQTYAIYLELIQNRLQPLPGAVEFIRACKSAKLALAVATSADHVKMQGNLKQIGVPPETFAAIVTGSEIERKKPFPDIFQLAAERLSLAAEACLVIEDAPNGIQAGKAAGSLCLGLTTSFDEKTLRAAGADFIAPDLAHVPASVFDHLGLAR